MTGPVAAVGVACTRPGCEGHADDDGYCDICGLRCTAGYVAVAADPYAATGVSRLVVPTTASRPTSVPGTDPTTRSSGARGYLGAGLVDVDPVEPRDAAAMVLADPHVPAARRTCSNCGSHLGAEREGRPARPDGYCTVCGHRFSFTPKLAKGDLVGGQYLVAGCLAHGGMGWLYLAQDQRLDGRWVVLKGLLDTGDAAAMSAAIAERRFLAQVSHTNIVEVYNFVEHRGDGYIVMEFVGGESLRDIRRAHREESGRPLPLTTSLAYALEVLSALGFLHSRGLLYCDLKPDNVIQTGELLKLIDLGGVRRIDDVTGDVYGTIGYQAPEIQALGPSVASDLYTVGRLLAVLAIDFPGYQDESRFATTLPPAAAVEAFTTYPSFHRLLLRATDRDPARRFSSAPDMADQMIGVLRQVMAQQGGTVPAASSRWFSGERASDPDQPSWRSLPLPLADPDDDAAGILINLAAASPADVISALQDAPDTPAVQRRRVRALLEAGDPGAARLRVALIEPADWRTHWWAGIAAAADGDAATARGHLDAVAAWLPGELVPALALGMCAETVGLTVRDFDLEQARQQWARAARHYEVARSTDPALGIAAFGSARVHQLLGDREGAARALRAVPTTAAAHATAQVRLCRTLCQALGDDLPSAEHLGQASDLIAAMIDDGVPRSTTLALRRDLLVAAHGLLTTDPGAAAGLTVAGTRCTDQALRESLEQTLRDLASLAPTSLERDALIDEANDWRPWTRT